MAQEDPYGQVNLGSRLPRKEAEEMGGPVSERGQHIICVGNESLSTAIPDFSRVSLVEVKRVRVGGWMMRPVYRGKSRVHGTIQFPVSKTRAHP